MRTRYTMEENGAKVFDGVQYYVIESGVKNPSEVKQLLKEGGASREFYMGGLVSHVISDVPVDPDTLADRGQDCVIIHSDWVVMSYKCGAQLPSEAFDSSSANKLFSGLVFCPSKLSASDMQKLCVLGLFHGARTQRRLDQKVTHLITTEISGPKYESAQRQGGVGTGLRVVSPDWVLDSVDAGTRLPEDQYHPSSFRRLVGAEPAATATAAAVEVPAEAHNGEILSSGAAATPEQPARQCLPRTEGKPPQVPEPVAVSMLPDTRVNSSPPRAASVGPAESPQCVESGGGVVVRVSSEDKSPPPAAVKSEQLLDGVVICFTDYQDCVEDNTLEKWRLVVEQHGGQVLDASDLSKCTHLLALHKKSSFFEKAMDEGKCVASAHWLNDVLTEQKMFPPRNPIHFPTAFKWQLPNAELYSMTLTNYVDTERELVKDMLRICGIPYTGHLSRSNTHLICKRAGGKKYEKALEWGVQVVNSTFLADIIHNGQLPSTVFPRYTSLGRPDEFDTGKSFEASRILDPWKPFLGAYSQAHPDLVLEGCLAPPAQEVGFPVRGKRGRPQDLAAEGALVEKVRRLVQVRKRPPVVLFTGISTSIVKNLKQIVIRLGGVFTERAQECSHIVTPRVARTIKFLAGISVCDCVVTPKWVEESGRRGSFLPEEDYLLRDPDAEQLFGMNLVQSLVRARERKLMGGLGVYATPSVQPPPNALGEIVRCAGGELLSLAQVRSILSSGGGGGGGAQGGGGVATEGVVVLSTPADIGNGCCTEFTMRNIKVYNAELILIGVLKQSLDYSQYAFILD